MTTKTIPRVKEKPTETPRRIKRLSPDKLCPGQGDEIVRIIRREFP